MSPTGKPAADEVDLWVASLDATPAELARAQALLSDEERARFARVIRPRQRERLIAARAALRRALAAYLGATPGEVRIEVGPGGKPRLGEDAQVSFSLSHSGALAAVAVTRRAAVGLDIEMLGREVTPGVIRRALAPDEQDAVARVGRERRAEAFLRHWTAKEAYAKATGAGLAVGMADVVIADALGSPQLAGREGWAIQRFDPRPGYVGAVVVAGGPWRARLREL